MANPNQETTPYTAKPESGRAPIDWMKRGKFWLIACVACLVIGKAIAKIFFSDMIGDGLTLPIMLILLPIWSMGLAGMVMIVIGKCRKSATEDEQVVSTGALSESLRASTD